MEAPRIFRYLDDARRMGVKEIYFTGGEPFIHRSFLAILECALRDFPVSVLTNGVLIDRAKADRLRRIADGSRFSLEIRISIDDHVEVRNDAIRGKGTFRKALNAYQLLYDRGFLPILTVTEMRDYLDPRGVERDLHGRYVKLLRSFGIDRPRIKVIPIFEMGMLPTPSEQRPVTPEMLRELDPDALQCSSSRIVAHDGVYACPILVGEPEARLADDLEGGLQDCSLYHSSCHTCYVTGMTCKNF
jgi:sulfatase maturation enzyme AslB (radical SAM superfamily)